MEKFKFLGFILVGLLLTSCGNDPTPVDPTPVDPTPVVEFYDPPKYEGDSISIHYQRTDGNYSSWALWLWNGNGGTGSEFLFNGLDSFGGIAGYQLSQFGSDLTRLGFIVKGKGNWTKDVESDRFIELSEYAKDSNKIYHIYLKQGDPTVYSSPELGVNEAVTKAEFSSTSTILINGTQNISKAEIFADGKNILTKEVNPASKSVSIDLPEGTKADFNKSYKTKVTFASSVTREKSISITSLYKTDDFGNAFNYDGNDLGANYSKTNTTFKVWSPVSSSIKLRLYKSGTPKSVYSGLGDDTIYLEKEMVKGQKGVFETTINEDLSGIYYTYVVTNGQYSDKEIVDPYAKSAGINGKRGMVVDFDSIQAKPEGWDNFNQFNIDRKALTVYETHVADVTSSASWTGKEENKKRFAGMYEEGTTYTEGEVTVKTGFDHIKELGVNAVQLVPVFDQDNDEKKPIFNWGYNPLNYNCLEGVYSSDPKDGYVRIKEFRTLVEKYHEAGINIIMDVVYNHVSGANGSNFDVLMPNYYFRYNAAGDLSNGSGCGNETASELPMMRKFIKDSICFLTKTYKLGGYRFDLMGLHDLETMNYVTAEAKKVFDGIVIYGEPWNGGTSTLADSMSAKQMNSNSYVGYGQFNDQMRDALIKGGLNSASSKGWVTDSKSAISDSDTNKLISGIKGITKTDSILIADPNKTVNYVTCHDNYTLYDRVNASGTKDEDTVRKMAMLANSVVFTSQAQTFMLAGEEFLRTKNGDYNSYQSSYKVNELNYALKIKNLDIFENYQRLISLKHNLDGLHLDIGANQGLEVTINAEKSMISYNLSDKANGKTYKVIHANGLVKDGTTIDLSSYNLYLDTLSKDKVLNNQTTISKYETIIAYK